MSEFHDDLTVEQDGDSDLVKSLRAQLRNAHKERDGFKKQVEDAAKAAAAQTVADAVKAKGLDPDVVKYVPDSVTDEASLGKWLEGDGKLFSKMLAAPETTTEQKPAAETTETGGKPEPQPETDPQIAAFLETLAQIQATESGGWSPQLAAGEAAKARALSEAAKTVTDPEGLIALMQSGKLDAAVSS